MHKSLKYTITVFWQRHTPVSSKPPIEIQNLKLHPREESSLLPEKEVFWLTENPVTWWSDWVIPPWNTGSTISIDNPNLIAKRPLTCKSKALAKLLYLNRISQRRWIFSFKDPERKQRFKKFRINGGFSQNSTVFQTLKRWLLKKKWVN